ncbi:ArdC family protein [Acidiphilium acidophilum]|uniref:ArdC family protein n=1 Tax=Acidiphilium acidophilum TaxID=76588 RepID=A0AAW9DL37_ACIAO|nr:ArdC family protein [Acidiphilium acidophilum]MDX5929739.1 ArdC family protein [Acidiphilium acidophilum]
MRNPKCHRPHRTHRPAATPRDIYQEVTDKIIAALERGVLPWQRGWDQVACGAPMNPTTGRV